MVFNAVDHTDIFSKTVAVAVTIIFTVFTCL